MACDLGVGKVTGGVKDLILRSWQRRLAVLMNFQSENYEKCEYDKTSEALFIWLLSNEISR